MPSNDLLLIDSILQKTKNEYGTRKDDAEYFELFVIDTVLKNYDLSLDDLEDGWVDGPEDGGVDGLYVFIDGMLLSDQFDLRYVRNEPLIEVFVFTVKSSDSFKQAAVTALTS